MLDAFNSRDQSKIAFIFDYSIANFLETINIVYSYFELDLLMLVVRSILGLFSVGAENDSASNNSSGISVIERDNKLEEENKEEEEGEEAKGNKVEIRSALTGI